MNAAEHQLLAEPERSLRELVRMALEMRCAQRMWLEDRSHLHLVKLKTTESHFDFHVKSCRSRGII